jgi:hypothetical protein
MGSKTRRAHWIVSSIVNAGNERSGNIRTFAGNEPLNLLSSANAWIQKADRGYACDILSFLC